MKGTYKMAPSYSCPSCNANMAKTARTCYKCGWNIDDEIGFRKYRFFKVVALIGFWGFMIFMTFLLWLSQGTYEFINEFKDPRGSAGMIVLLFFGVYAILKFLKYGRRRFLLAAVVACIATYFIHYAVGLVLGILCIKLINRRY